MQWCWKANRQPSLPFRQIGMPADGLLAGKHEISFYIAVECYPDVKKSWDLFQETYFDSYSYQEKLSEIPEECESNDLSAQSIVLKEFDSNRTCQESHFILNFSEHENQRFHHFIQSEIKTKRRRKYEEVRLQDESLLNRYLDENMLTKLDLEGVRRFYDPERTFDLHQVMFSLPQLKHLEYLNLSQNAITSLPLDIGRLKELKRLFLSYNHLKCDGIPYTLTFCTKLEVLLLNENTTLESLPGFLLNMKSLKKVYRLGSKSYIEHARDWSFLSTAVRIGYSPCCMSELSQGIYISDTRKISSQSTSGEVPSLLSLAERSIFRLKCDYFTADIPSYVKENLAQKLSHYNSVCQQCNKLKLQSDSTQGYFIYFRKIQYLGNTNVPFKFWVCGQLCLQTFRNYLVTENQYVGEETQDEDLYGEETAHKQSNNAVSDYFRSKLGDRTPRKLSCTIL